ncbi:MAG: amidohydrolase family protein [Acidimicrobiales bacterium]|nr:amidohydrolase family protein [Acidimicrobiales bacterium]
MTAATPVIDTDTHITEPRDTWTARMSKKKWGDMIPHVVYDADAQEEFWYLGDRRLVPACMTAQAGWPEKFPSHPKTFEQAHPASFEAKARIELMDGLGIWAQALYPNVGGFGSQVWKTLEPQELAFDCVRAYNDMLFDWTSVDPRRFIPICAVPFWNIEESVKEIDRVAPLGAKGIIVSGAPQVHGLAILGDRQWDPLWAAAEANGLPISFHVGSGDMTSQFSRERIMTEGFGVTYARASTSLFFDTAIQLTDLLFSGVLPRFPGLSFVSVESGIGWIPFLLEAADYHFIEGDVRKERPEFEELPSFYYRRQVYANYWFEKVAPLKLLDEIGHDRILFETDFPHPTCLQENQVREAVAFVNTLPDDLRRKILWENAATLYKIDPAEIPGALTPA